MRYKMIVDINQEQRDDLIKRFETAVPNSDNLYRIVLSATETQRLTMLEDLQASPKNTHHHEHRHVILAGEEIDQSAMV